MHDESGGSSVPLHDRPLVYIVSESIASAACIICMYRTRQYQAGVSRHVWKAGGALRPYFEDVVNIVQNVASFAGR